MIDLIAILLCIIFLAIIIIGVWRWEKMEHEWDIEYKMQMIRHQEKIKVRSKLFDENRLELVKRRHILTPDEFVDALFKLCIEDFPIFEDME